MKVRRWTPPLVSAAIILVAKSIPNPELPASRAARPNRGLLGLLAVLVPVLTFAGLDEWHQQFVPGRLSELGDWLAGAGGALMGTTLAAVVRARGRSPA